MSHTLHYQSIFLKKIIFLNDCIQPLGLAMKCYFCHPNETLTSTGKSSCIPKPIDCKNETHCMSIRTRSRDLERTYKTCAFSTTCVSGHHTCLNLSRAGKQECHAHCCDRDLCNLKVHEDENHNASKQTGHGNSVHTVLVSLTMLMTSLLLHLL